MTKQNSFKPTLLEIAKLQIELKEKGGPTEDGTLFEEILNLQDSILKIFGLPGFPEYEKYISFDKFPSDMNLDKIILLLHGAAAAYLLSPIKSDLQYLRDAQDFKKDGFLVLPELKIATHIYTIFVYEKILLKKKDTVENILQELRLVNEPDILDSLGQLAQGTLENKHEVTAILKADGVKYIEQFIIHNSNLLSDDDY